LVLYRRDALQEFRNRGRILLRQEGEIAPRHDRGEHPSVGTPSRFQRCHDLFDVPVADTGLPVRRDVGPGEGAEPRNLEGDVGAAEKLRHIRLAKEVPRRMAVAASGKGEQVFASFDAGISGVS
jgi:hypothetical protein